MTRHGYALVTALAAELFAGLFVTVAIVAPRPRLIWNASASAPLGLYALHGTDTPAIGDLVAAMPPEPLAKWMEARRYLPRGVPLLKHIAAKAGQRICRRGNRIRVDGRTVATALDRDGHGRPLPVWHGCRTLGRGDIFLLNPAVSDSLDGRYFGMLPASALLGRATPILTRDAPGEPLRWRASAPLFLHPKQKAWR
jgi:conjugative transfer signal peptidase TraF